MKSDAETDLNAPPRVLLLSAPPRPVQPHLRKCFEAIESLDFGPGGEIGAMNSREKEKVPFDKSMTPQGNVEIWLGEAAWGWGWGVDGGYCCRCRYCLRRLSSPPTARPVCSQPPSSRRRACVPAPLRADTDALVLPVPPLPAGEVERRMRSSVRQQIMMGMAAYATIPRKQWVRDWPAMVVLAVSAVFWSKEVEDAIIGEAPARTKKAVHQGGGRCRWGWGGSLPCAQGGGGARAAARGVGAPPFEPKGRRPPPAASPKL